MFTISAFLIIVSANYKMYVVDIYPHFINFAFTMKELDIRTRKKIQNNKNKYFFIFVSYVPIMKLEVMILKGKNAFINEKMKNAQ